MRVSNKLVERLEDNEVLIGMQCFTGNHTVIEVLGATGFDYVWLDCEHSALNPRALEDTMRTCEAAGIIPLLRIPEPADGTSARRALEAGAEGVIVPMVRSAQDVTDIVNALRFPPAGKRGLCPALRVPGYSPVEFNPYMEWNNDHVLVIPMIETVEGLEDVEAICAIQEVKLLVFASGELAFAMGEGTNMQSSPRIQEAQERVYAAAREHGVALIGGPILNPSPETCAQAIDEGISVLCIGIDVLAFRTVCESTVTAAMTAIEASTSFHHGPVPPSGFPPSY